MKYEVRQLSVTEMAIRHVTSLARDVDKTYAIQMGYDSLRDGLEQSIEESALVYGVFDKSFCVAIVGAIEDVFTAQVWVQTSSLTDREPRAVLEATQRIMELIEEADPEKELWVSYRADNRIRLLAHAAGFERGEENYEVNGIKHTVAWR